MITENKNQALIVIDAQNEFSLEGKRPVHNFLPAIGTIARRVKEARSNNWPIAWVKHHNKPNESKAFVPGSWGARFYDGFGPQGMNEVEFVKNVYGAFTGTDIENWLKSFNANKVLIVGFYTHGCLSTTAREAIMRDLTVVLDPDATGTCDLEDTPLGKLSAEQVHKSALIQLVNMGAELSKIS
jgi:nicotinamidase-related amidase